MRCKSGPPALASVPLNVLCAPALASLMTQTVGGTVGIHDTTEGIFKQYLPSSTVGEHNWDGTHARIAQRHFYMYIDTVLIRLCEEWPIARLEVKGGYNLWIQSTNQFWAICWFWLIQANINFTETFMPPWRPGNKDWIKHCYTVIRFTLPCD